MDNSTDRGRITSSNHPRNPGFTSTGLPNERWQRWANHRASSSLSTEGVSASGTSAMCQKRTFGRHELGSLALAVRTSSRELPSRPACPHREKLFRRRISPRELPKAGVLARLCHLLALATSTAKRTVGARERDCAVLLQLSPKR